jgi:hypothetical protein
MTTAAGCLSCTSFNSAHHSHNRRRSDELMWARLKTAQGAIDVHRLSSAICGPCVCKSRCRLADTRSVGSGISGCCPRAVPQSLRGLLESDYCFALRLVDGVQRRRQLKTEKPITVSERLVPALAFSAIGVACIVSMMAIPYAFFLAIGVIPAFSSSSCASTNARATPTLQPPSYSTRIGRATRCNHALACSGQRITVSVVTP